MTKKHWRTRYPIESFDPRWEKLLKVAALRTAVDPLTLTFPTYKEAFTFHQRIYQFRGKARETEHPDWKLFLRVRITRKANVLRLFAQDSQFDDIFAQAGLEDDAERPRLGPDDDIMSDPDLAALLKPMETPND